LLETKDKGLSYHDIGRRLAERLNRSPGAVRTRLQKLAKKGPAKEAATPEPAKKTKTSTPLEGQVKAPFNDTAVTNLLGVSLILVENPCHLPAVKVLLSRAIQLLQGRDNEAVNVNSRLTQQRRPLHP